jgi:hypothetical protein
VFAKKVNFSQDYLIVARVSDRQTCQLEIDRKSLPASAVSTDSKRYHQDTRGF